MQANNFSSSNLFEQINQSNNIFLPLDEKLFSLNTVNINSNYDCPILPDLNLNKSFNCQNVNINNSEISNLNINSIKPQLSKKKRAFFTNEEDEKLKELVNKYGTRKWSLIASFMNNRTSRQCRDRYFNYLFPGCFKGQWTNEQDDLLIQLYLQYGPKWSFFSKNFPGRTPNSLKNRWNYFLSKKIETPNIDNNNNNNNELFLKEKIMQDEINSIYEEDYCKYHDFLTFNDEYQFLQ